jgi:hypothetical protein
MKRIYNLPFFSILVFLLLVRAAIGFSFQKYKSYQHAVDCIWKIKNKKCIRKLKIQIISTTCRRLYLKKKFQSTNHINDMPSVVFEKIKIKMCSKIKNTNHINNISLTVFDKKIKMYSKTKNTNYINVITF